jgi:hypothetical protein
LYDLGVDLPAEVSMTLTLDLEREQKGRWLAEVLELS